MAIDVSFLFEHAVCYKILKWESSFHSLFLVSGSENSTKFLSQLNICKHMMTVLKDIVQRFRTAPVMINIIREPVARSK